MELPRRPMIHPITLAMRQYMQAYADPVHAAGARKYFGEHFLAYGVHGAKKKVAQQLRAALKAYGPIDGAVRLSIVEELLASRMYEEGQAAILLLNGHAADLGYNGLERLHGWIDQYVDNWGICDSLCLGIVWQVAQAASQHVTILMAWASDPNPWVRRAACVTVLRLNRAGQDADVAIELSNSLLLQHECDHWVQKAWGWMLKQLVALHPELAERYLLTRQGLPPLVVTHATARLPKSVRAHIKRQRPSCHAFANIHSRENTNA